MEKSALIMMTTYNGEKYLTQQINSILDQTYENWKLIVRDDGSSDKTNRILSSYESEDSRIKVCYNNADKHNGYLDFNCILYHIYMLYKFYLYLYSKIKGGN